MGRRRRHLERATVIQFCWCLGVARLWLQSTNTSGCVKPSGTRNRVGSAPVHSASKTPRGTPWASLGSSGPPINIENIPYSLSPFLLVAACSAAGCSQGGPCHRLRRGPSRGAGRPSGRFASAVIVGASAAGAAAAHAALRPATGTAAPRHPAGSTAAATIAPVAGTSGVVVAAGCPAQQRRLWQCGDGGG